MGIVIFVLIWEILFCCFSFFSFSSFCIVACVAFGVFMQNIPQYPTCVFDPAIHPLHREWLKCGEGWKESKNTKGQRLKGSI